MHPGNNWRSSNGRFPAARLTDELLVGEDGNVIDAFVGHQYRRRRPAADGKQSG
jgi:hypothetical protein